MIIHSYEQPSTDTPESTGVSPSQVSSPPSREPPNKPVPLIPLGPGKVALPGMGLRLPGFEGGIPLKPSQIAAAHKDEVPEWMRKLQEKKQQVSNFRESDIEHDRHNIEERRKKEAEEERFRESERKQKEEEQKKLEEFNRVAQHEKEEEIRKLEIEKLKSQNEEEIRKTEAESKKKRDQVLLWAEERKREEFQRRTVSKQFESSGDTSSLVLFLKSELEKLQIALSQKDKDIEQLVMDNTNEKTKLKSQLSELQEKFLQTNLQKETLEKRITERDLYVDKCKERIDTQSKTFDRFSEERNELDEEMNKLRKNLKEKQSLIQEHEDEIAALKITITELRTSLKSPESPKREEVNEEDTDENEEVLQHPHSARERYFYRDDDSEVETEENLDSTEEDEGFQNNIDSYFVNQENEEKV
jgi:hypothetical protein